MVDESSSGIPPAEESIEAETDTALEPEPESGEPTLEPASEPGFVCDCEEWMRSACEGLLFYKEQESRRYCVLHFPGKEKSADFKVALERKLDSKDFDFQGVWFPDEVEFSRFEFSADADFRAATFSARANFNSATFSADADFSSATFSAYAYFFSATFSVDAYFSEATFSADAEFMSVTFSAVADFSGATFSAGAKFISAKFSAEADFGSATFSAAAAYFSSATFSADANFRFAKFGAIAHFRGATFSADAYFISATFSAPAYFSFAKFSADAYFSSAKFSEDADFSSARFSAGAYFNYSLFDASVSFFETSFAGSVQFFGTAERELQEVAVALGDYPSLDFQLVTVEHPDRIVFQTLILRPHWFVNVDSRSFVFTDVSWDWEHISINEEIAALKAKKVSSRNRLLAIACHKLAENAEANNRYEEASKFRYWAMELQRQEMDPIWKEDWYEFAFWRLDWWYWATSGYGERIVRAFLMLFGIWLVFMLLYTQVGFTKLESKSETPTATTVIAAEPDAIGQPLSIKRASIYSLAVMSLQKPEPKPLTGTAQTLVLLETILGPVQAALLALAIRRKFMR